MSFTFLNKAATMFRSLQSFRYLAVLHIEDIFLSQQKIPINYFTKAFVSKS